MSNEAKYRVLITAASYKDDWENGEVDGTFQLWEVCEKTFGTIEEAVRWFKDMYEVTNDPSLAVFVDSYLNRFYAPQPMQAVSRNEDFIKASESDIRDWKEGKTQLYNLEYWMDIKKITDVDGEELLAAAASEGVKEG